MTLTSKDVNSTQNKPILSKFIHTKAKQKSVKRIITPKQQQQQQKDSRQWEWKQLWLTSNQSFPNHATDLSLSSASELRDLSLSDLFVVLVMPMSNLDIIIVIPRSQSVPLPLCCLVSVCSAKTKTQRWAKTNLEVPLVRQFIRSVLDKKWDVIISFLICFFFQFWLCS